MNNCEKCSGTGYQKNEKSLPCKMCNQGYCIYCKGTFGLIEYPYIECTKCFGTGYKDNLL